MLKQYCIILGLLLVFDLTGQSVVNNAQANRLQYGIAGKLNLELQSGKGNPNLKFSLTTGLSYDIKHINFAPALHAGVLLFNKGTVGSALDDPWYKIRTHFFYSALGTIKLDHRNFNYVERYVPLYHFADFTANPLQNPYKSSFSFGAIWAHMPKKTQQRLGFFNTNIAGRAQITYYNDGGPVLRWFGDKRDRYYTGGLLVSYHGNEKAAIDLVELSYHKFTGYVKHAFDVGEKLQMDFLVYADQSQFTFNHHRWKINVADLSSGFSGNMALYDINSLDLQDFLHFNSNVPYHPDYFNGWRFAIGGRYEYNYLHLE